MASPQTENGYTKIANELYEKIVGFSLTGYQLRVVFSVIRKTYGYGKKDDVISLSQLTQMTNIAKPHVCRAIKELKAMKIVTTDGNRIGINKNYDLWLSVTTDGNSKPLPRMVTPVTKTVTTITMDGNKSLPSAALQKKDKETITKEIIHKNVLGFGKPEINELSAYFLQVFQLPTEDCPKGQSRQYWNHLLKESKTGVAGVKWLIEQAHEDEFWKNNITSSKDLYYKRVKIIARKRGNIPKMATMPKEVI